MTKEQKQLAQYLFAQYIEGKCTQRQEQLLFEMMNDEKEGEEWEAIVEELMMVEPEMNNYNRQEWEVMIQSILKQRDVNRGRLFNMSRMVKWVAAACIVFIVGIAAYLLLSKNQNKVVAVRPSWEISPGHDGAILTLSDGKQIVLDSTKGTIANEGGTMVVNKNGSVSYNQTTDVGSTRAAVYNTITTPKGRQYSLMLADGSKVWLNAASSITYPTAFVGNERRVIVKGEAYFEVTHDVHKPFIVQNSDVSVRVLGTHFNVNAYEDEDAIRVTLLEGSVKVNNNAGSVLIKPGQQAVLASNHQPSTMNSVDLDEVMAWKNGQFIFNKTDIQTAMRQIARWYDVDIEYGGVVNGSFSGTIARQEDIKQVLKMLELTDEAHFMIDGKKVIVKP